MKLLFGENLSPSLERAPADLYPGSIHIQSCNLGNADDQSVWQFAKENGFIIVSKDSDFQDRSVLYGHPPKFIWLRVGNCRTGEIENLLRIANASISQFAREQTESHLMLGLRRKPASTKGRSVP